MPTVKNARIPRDQRSTFRIFAVLTIVFFSSLAAVTLFGTLFVHQAVREERQKQAEARAEGFAKALKTILKMTDSAGQALVAIFNDSDLETYRSSVETYLAAAPWTKAVILDAEGDRIVNPEDLSTSMLDLPLASKTTNNSKVFGPFTLDSGERVLIYRYEFDEGQIELVVSFESVLRAIGLIELERTIQLSVQTSINADVSEIAFSDHDISMDGAIHRDVDSDNSKWTVSVAPVSLSQGAFDWTSAFRLAAGLLILAFIAPMVALLLLIRARQRDNVDIRRAMMEAENLSLHLDVALRTSSIGLWEHDLQTGQQIWDDQILKIFGLEGQSNIQSYDSWHARVHPDDKHRFRRFNWQDLTQENAFLTEYRIVTPDGTEKTIRSAGNAYRNADGERKIVGVNWDVTKDKALQNALVKAKSSAEAQNVELEKARAQMEEIALQDTLTGIPNRRLFEKRMEAMQTNGKLPEGMRIVLIDLDGFKSVNDTMGHFFGDEVLRYAANVFMDKLGPNDFLARTGGDEFVALMPAGSDVESFAAEVTSSFSGPVRIAERTCRLGVSLGIATAENSSDSAADLLVKADVALYEAKDRGRGRTVNYTSALMDKTFALKRLADEIQEAIETREILAHFQPIIDIRTSMIVGVEALARWQHPTRGLLEPREFLPVAEQIGLLHKIDDIVFERALSTLKYADEAGVALPAISVNISSQRLRDPALIDQLTDLAPKLGTINFELLESIPFDNPDAALISTLDAIRELGVGIDLDDFGSGYASLVGLTQVRPDRLKIAGQLISPITSSQQSVLIVETITRIAKSFGIDVICEGVTSREHSLKLEALGCFLQQGYYFSRPMDQDQLIAFLSDHNDRV